MPQSYRRLKMACYMTNISMSVVGNLSPLLFLTFHASYGLGRFAQGLLWFRKLTGQSVAEITYNDFDEEVPAEYIAIAKEAVDSL